MYIHFIWCLQEGELLNYTTQIVFAQMTQDSPVPLPHLLCDQETQSLLQLPPQVGEKFRGKHPGFSLPFPLSFCVGVCHKLSRVLQLINRCMDEWIICVYMIEYVNMHHSSIIVYFWKDRRSIIHSGCLEKPDKEVQSKKHNKLGVTSPNCNWYTRDLLMTLF